MSADDGIYILVTKGTEEGQLEYRVAWTQAIENLNWNPEYVDPDCLDCMSKPACTCEPGGYDPNYMDVEFARDVFGGSQVFTDRRDALEAAADFDGPMGWTEYGINILDHSSESFPTEATVV